MNPLSTWTFYRRHKRWTMLLLALISLATFGLYLLGGLALATFTVPDLSVNMYLKNFSGVMPADGNELDPTVVSRIRINPDVARVLVAKGGIEIEVPDIVGGDSDLYLIGLRQADVPYVMEKNGVTLKEGRLLRPSASEIMLSDKVAAALDLHLGDTIDRSMDTDLYDDILEPMEVVGILAGDVRLAVVSYEYLDNHELYRGEVASVLMVEAQKGREAAVDDFLVNEIQSRQTDVLTFRLLMEQLTREQQRFYFFAAPLSIMVTIMVTVVIGVINQIALTRRLPEFGILHAAGYSKKWLTRRLTLKTAVLAGVGWVMGIGLSWLILHVIKLAIFAPRGHDLNPISSIPLVSVIPIPVAVIAFTVVGATRIFSRLDAVAIVERGELSLEESQRQTARTSPAKKASLPQPLSALTFYKRHGRRAVLLTGAMSLMIMMVSLLIFYLSISEEAQAAHLKDYRRVSAVWPSVDSLDPGVVAQIKTHPTVERIVLAARLHPLSVVIPPFEDENVNTFGVSEADMAYLVDLYGLELKEGHLPRPHTNEMVISEVTAQNRDLEVGDVIGSYYHPAYEQASVLPAEMVISGIFARPTMPEDENWLSFASLEFIDSHEAYATSSRWLLVVPKAGQKPALDEWLENKVASDQVGVITYDQMIAHAQERTRTLILTMALIESVMAIVAAIALAVLNYIFISQRQSEFGVLHALGFSRLRLVWRALRETAFTTGAAWGLSAIACLVTLLYLQFKVFTPLGLRFSLFNLTPWLFTLPIPVAVLTVTAGAIARTLSRLDPVSIIERR